MMLASGHAQGPTVFSRLFSTCGRGGSPRPAQLARWLQVSERTIYRDVQELAVSGVPVEGEAGAGYRIRPGYDLTPVMFAREEN